MKQDKQLGDRVAESHIIDLSFCRMNSFTRKDTAKHASVTLKGNQFVIIDNHLDDRIPVNGVIDVSFLSATFEQVRAVVFTHGNNKAYQFVKTEP